MFGVGLVWGWCGVMCGVCGVVGVWGVGGWGGGVGGGLGAHVFKKL